MTFLEVPFTLRNAIRKLGGGKIVSEKLTNKPGRKPPHVAGPASGKIKELNELAYHGFNATADFEEPLNSGFRSHINHVIAQRCLQIDANRDQIRLFGF